MALFDSKSQSVSAWASVAHAGNAQPASAAGSGLADWIQQGAAERRQQSELGWFEVECVNFSSDNYRFVDVSEGDLRTGLRTGQRTGQRTVGRLVDSFGVVWQEFRFADPVHDVRLIKQRKVRWLRPVTFAEITRMLSDAGVFDVKNKSRYNGSRYECVWKEGQGGGQLDFSWIHLRKLVHPDFEAKNEAFVPFLFYVDGVAHNYFNFGNFLFGAAGAALGLTVGELKTGAHVNSLVHSDTNGYDPQLDSEDDQFSIDEGFRYAHQHNLAQRTARWVQPQWGLPRSH